MQIFVLLSLCYFKPWIIILANLDLNDKEQPCRTKELVKLKCFRSEEKKWKGKTFSCFAQNFDNVQWNVNLHLNNICKIMIYNCFLFSVSPTIIFLCESSVGCFGKEECTLYYIHPYVGLCPPHPFALPHWLGNCGREHLLFLFRLAWRSQH